MNFNLQTSQIDLGSLWFQKCAYPLPRSTFANDCAPEIFKHFPPIERDNISHNDLYPLNGACTKKGTCLFRKCLF